MKKFEGHVVGSGMKIGIVAARFNEFIVSKLIGGAEDALVRHGVDMDQVDLAWVPGAFEIPLVAQKMAASGNMMLLSVWVRLLKDLHPTMTMYVQR